MSTPSELHADLTAERLAFVKDLIKEARDSAADAHDEDAGERPWSLGCRALERVIHRISQAAKDTPWLKVIDPSLHFRFSIGRVPVGVYKGPADQPSVNTLKQRIPELHAKQLAWSFSTRVVDELLVRFAVETNDTGHTSAISLVSVDGDEDIVDHWELFPVPYRATAPANVANVTQMQAQPKKLPKAKLSAKKKAAGKGDSASETGGEKNG